MPRCRIGALLAALGALSGSAVEAEAASPRPEKLAILPVLIAGPHGEASLSSVLADVYAAAELRVGLRLLSQEEMFVAGSSELVAKVRDCGSDTACTANRLRSFDARLGLVVVVNLAIEPPLLGLQLLDTDERRLVAESLGAVEAADGGISAAIRRRAAELLERAGYPQAGRLKVVVQPVNARVAIDGYEPDRGSVGRFTLPPGRYEVRAEADGHLPGTAAAVVTGGQESSVALSLVEESSVLGAWWFWTAIGVAVAGGTAAALVATRSTTRCLCTTLNGVGCEVCE